MDLKELMYIFPLKGEVTQEIINNSNIQDVRNCIGSNTLINALGKNAEEVSVFWGNIGGAIFGGCVEHEDVFKDRLVIGTEQNTHFMDIKQPCTVTFKIEKYEQAEDEEEEED